MSDQSPTLMTYIIHWLLSGAAVLLTSKLIPGFNVKGFASALWAAVIIGLANVIIWPLLIFLTLPINILTLGLFTFVVNGAVLKLVATLLDGFEIKSWWSAIFGAIALSIITVILHAIFS